MGHEPARRRDRLSSAAVDAVLILGPALPILGFYADPDGPRGWGGAAMLVGLVGIAGLGVVMLLALEAVAIRRSGRTIGMAYVGLALDTSAPASVFLVDAAILAASAALAVYALSLAHGELETLEAQAISAAVGAVALLLPNLAPLAGRERRTLADWISGVRVVRRAPVRETPRFGGMPPLAVAIDATAVLAPIVPAALALLFGAGVEEMHGFLAGAAGAALLVVAIEIRAFYATRETIGTRVAAWREP